MVSVTGTPGSTNQTFVIRPNQSLTWREAKIIYAGLVAISLVIGVTFYSIGLTLVLPFSGLEMVVLGVSLYVCLCQNQRRETIVINEQSVTVESRFRKPEHCQEFHRSWVHVSLEEPAHRGHPSRLLLRSHGRELEVASFLNEAERCEFAVDLKSAIQQK